MLVRPLLALALSLWSGVACAERKTAAGAQETSRVASPASALADSLVLRTAAGAEVWFTASRPATESLGQRCTERVMEIRREGRRTPIPLLYTGVVPELVNDSTIRARIWLHCRPGNTYEVNLRTGFPVRVER
ncbi:MAG: hypothetical protein ACREMO_03775 [Gemmatimonadales bacterium]